MYSAKSSSGSQLRTVSANWEGRVGFYLPVRALGRLGWHRAVGTVRGWQCPQPQDPFCCTSVSFSWRDDRREKEKHGAGVAARLPPLSCPRPPWWGQLAPSQPMSVPRAELGTAENAALLPASWGPGGTLFSCFCTGKRASWGAATTPRGPV